MSFKSKITIVDFADKVIFQKRMTAEYDFDQHVALFDDAMQLLASLMSEHINKNIKLVKFEIINTNKGT